MELPPPIHGVTYTNKIIYDSLKDDYFFYDTNFTVNVGEVSKFTFQKIMKNFFIIFGAWKTFARINPKKVYIVVSATKYGIIRDFMISLPPVLFQKKRLLHLHGFTYYKIYQKSWFYRFLFNIISKNSQLIVLCEEQKKQTNLLMNKSSIVIHNCLNKNSTIDIKKKKNDILQVCYISNISKEKGTFDLIQAVKQSKKNIKLVIAGNFLSAEDEFFSLIKDDENISYVGFADEKIKENILKSSDVFSLPSKLEEGSPISIIEAMSYGLPILATDKGCISEMICEIGYLLPDAYSSKDILNGLEYIDTNYDKLTANSLDKYQKNYSKNKFINHFKNILN